MCVTGVKNLLAGNQQAAVTVAVEGLMDAKANADLDAFITFDPKVNCLPSAIFVLLAACFTAIAQLHSCLWIFCVSRIYFRDFASKHSRPVMFRSSC